MITNNVNPTPSISQIPTAISEPQSGFSEDLRTKIEQLNQAESSPKGEEEKSYWELRIERAEKNAELNEKIYNLRQMGKDIPIAELLLSMLM